MELRTRMVTLRSISTPVLPENKQSQRIEWQQQRHHTDNSTNHVCGDDAAFGISNASGTLPWVLIARRQELEHVAGMGLCTPHAHMPVTLARCQAYPAHMSTQAQSRAHTCEPMHGFSGRSVTDYLFAFLSFICPSLICIRPTRTRILPSHFHSSDPYLHDSLPFYTMHRQTCGCSGSQRQQRSLPRGA